MTVIKNYERMKNKKKFWFLILLMFCIIGFFTCKELLRSQKIDIQEQLPKLCYNGKICFKDLQIKQEWDKILILGPYNKIDKYDVGIRWIDRKAINWSSHFDSSCTIVFLKDMKVMAFTYIFRDVFDFSEFDGKIYDRHKVFKHVDSPFNSEQLRNTTWEAAYTNGIEKRIEIYSDSTITALCEYPRIGKRDTTTFLYYLSDILPSRFDFSKVGKKTFGRYLVKYHNGHISSMELARMTIPEMYLKLTESNDTIKFIRK